MKYSKVIKMELVVEALPCLSCGGTELDFWVDRKCDTERVTCSKCKQQYSGSCSCTEGYYDLVVNCWNPANDPKIVAKKRSLLQNKCVSMLTALKKKAAIF